MGCANGIAAFDASETLELSLLDRVCMYKYTYTYTNNNNNNSGSNVQIIKTSIIHKKHY